MSDYGARAALALNTLLPGEHRDKLAARALNCSLRMAQYLRAGQHWTADRLSQASRVLGVEFDLLLTGVDLQSEIADVRRRIVDLETRLNRGNDSEDPAALGGAAADPHGGPHPKLGGTDRAA